jgi:uncharacterized protein (DUF305 family)
VQPGAGGGAMQSPAEIARADNGRPAYTAADVHFMQGMIGHHAQAILMANWAQTHGARPDVKILAQRIDVAQRDEIDLMQRWLRERGEKVPDADVHYEHAGMNMPGMTMPEMMPGMLTMQELAQLDSARGSDFDRRFLTFMIRHHEGAITMVDHLFGTPGAGQDVTIYRFAADVNADQATEIDRMRKMLAAAPAQ